MVGAGLSQPYSGSTSLPDAFSVSPVQHYYLCMWSIHLASIYSFKLRGGKGHIGEVAGKLVVSTIAVSLPILESLVKQVE